VKRLAFAVAIVALAPSAGWGQRVQPELRVDAIRAGAESITIQPGVGATARLGYYVRATASAGVAIERGTSELADRWRIDVMSRVLLDPFRQQRWGLSFGGGLTFRKRTYLAALVDLEGPEVRGWSPAVQGGVSGGLRAAVIARRAIPGRR
jgi:hypothetical protein